MNENPHISISVSPMVYHVAPQFVYQSIQCHIDNTSYDSRLWQEIEQLSTSIVESIPLHDIKRQPVIAATRDVYKKLGKNPNRYRPSAEALSRRVIKGDGLYQIDTVVDLINFVSLKSGYAIGGFDADKIVGNLTLGVGEKGEPFEAIGRGMLNIEGLPVYRDEIGGIGTPTSDVERTKITSTTKRLLMIINAYGGIDQLEKTTMEALLLLKKYANATHIQLFSSVI